MFWWKARRCFEEKSFWNDTHVDVLMKQRFKIDRQRRWFDEVIRKDRRVDVLMKLHFKMIETLMFWVMKNNWKMGHEATENHEKSDFWRVWEALASGTSTRRQKNKKCHKTGRRDRFLSSDRSCGHGSTLRKIFQASIWVKSDIFDTFFGKNLADMNIFLYLFSRYAGMDRYVNHTQLGRCRRRRFVILGSLWQLGVCFLQF